MPALSGAWAYLRDLRQWQWHSLPMEAEYFPGRNRRSWRKERKYMNKTIREKWIENVCALVPTQKIGQNKKQPTDPQMRGPVSKISGWREKLFKTFIFSPLQCGSCHACFHMKCFEKNPSNQRSETASCPKCYRLGKRKTETTWFSFRVYFYRNLIPRNSVELGAERSFTW